MKNKKGFTLIELLSVLVILGLIAVITVTAVSTTLKSYKETLYDKQINSIKSAAELWCGDHIFLMPNDSSSLNTCIYGEVCPRDYSKLIITLKTLQDEGFIDSEMINIKNKRDFEDVNIVISKNGKNREIEVIDKVFYAYKVGDKIKINVSDQSSPLDFYVIADSNNNSTYVKAIYASNISGQVCYECNSQNIDTSALASLDWPNAEEVRVITKEEVESALDVMQNDSDAQKQWIKGISGGYWTGTENESDITKAYYVDTNGNVQTTTKTTSLYVRPVIKISKSFISSSSFN